jgi:hypothetical protein
MTEFGHKRTFKNQKHFTAETQRRREKHFDVGQALPDLRCYKHRFVFLCASAVKYFNVC